MRHAATALAVASIAALGLAAAPRAIAQETGNHNSIQPETTLNISAEASVEAEPDIAMLSGGVTTERASAKEALAANSEAMNGLFRAFEKAGIAKKDIQTSTFSLQPRYEYPNNNNKREQRELVGYTASNQVSVKVRDISKTGSIIDAMASQGGNTFNGVSFAVEEPKALQDEARRKAMADALDRANLYAQAAGYSIGRIVTIDESGGYSPQPQMASMRMMASDESTPISGGEVSYSASVNVMFELVK